MAKKVMGFEVLFDLAILFVERQKGIWDYKAWLDFLLEVQREGFELSCDVKSYFGLMMELMKKLYETATATQGMEDVMIH